METTSHNFILFVCLFVAGYMTILQFKYYADNEDVASISYRKFNSETKSQYPAITICVRSVKGNLFKSSEFFRQAPNISERSYYSFLRGNLAKIEAIGKLRDINYDSVTGYVDDILIKGVFFNALGERSESRSDWFTRIHSTPDRVCYSVKDDFQQNYTLERTSVKLNATTLKEKELSLRIYIHQNGESLRDKRDFISISEKNVLQRYLNDFKLKGVEVLTKRANGKIPCNETSVNEDEVAREIIMKSVRCIPAFWMQFVSNSIIDKMLPPCNQDQYFKISQLEGLSLNFLPHAGYLESCTRMTTPVEYAANMGKTRNSSVVNLRFVYSSQWYKEIINNKAYTSGTLCGQVGGFVGKELWI